jgi:ribosomal protein S18 acetylase RimI-like enzyme
MAARPDPFAGGPEIVDIRQLDSRALSPLLLEETVEWDRELDWDFSHSAELIRQFADQRGLNGAALMDRGEVAGYGYVIIEEDKGLVGDVYVRPFWRTDEHEVRLFRTILDAVAATPGVRRVESQLMLTEQSVAQALQRERFVRVFERILMRFDTARALPPGRADVSFRFRIDPWGEHLYDAASSVISIAYVGHVDAQINDQYRTFAGARRFLYNVVQFPGCGEFFRPASFVAVDAITGWVAGISLCSFVSRDVGHITQLCVTPQAKGKGLGYEMLRKSVGALRAAGARRVTLTVTTANEEAVRLYRRCGFEEMRRFFAYVQEGQGSDHRGR